MMIQPSSAVATDPVETPTRTALEEHWNAAYAGGGSGASWTQVHPTPSLSALAAISPDLDAAIIDVGGGSSPLAGALLRAGHTDVTVLDLSSAALHIARGHLGDQATRVQWLIADVLDWRPPRQYVVWHDRAVLHFLTNPADRVRYAATLRDTVATGGCAIIAAFAPDGPTHCSGLPVQRYTADEILELLGDQFTAVLTATELHRTPNGHQQPFTWVAARRTTVAPDYREPPGA